MRFRSLIIGFVCAVLSLNSVVADVAQSALSSGTWYKIKITDSGVYKISATDLAAMGCTPQNVRIFGYGGAMLNEDFSQPYTHDLPEIAVWRGANEVLFYAQGAVSWTYDSKTRAMMHTRNPYSDAGYYFVTKDVGEGKTIALGTAETHEPTAVLNTFLDTYAHELDAVSLLASGREFYGEKIDFNARKLTFQHSFPNIDAMRNATVRVALVAKSDSQSEFQVNVNDKKAGSLLVRKISSSYNVAEEGISLFQFYPNQNNLTLDLEYKNPSNGSTAYLNFYELNVPRALKMTGDAMAFRNIDFASPYYTYYCKYNLAGTSSGVEIWNVTANDSVYRMPTTKSADTLSFVSLAMLNHRNQKVVPEYVAVKPNGTFPSPEIVGRVENQDLHGLTMCDMMIIAPKDFVPEAERLAEAHWQTSGLVVHVVTDEQVYNEFSSGTPDATAYRRLMKMFYDRQTFDDEHMLYLLLMGDGHFDNRGIENSVPETHRLLTYQSANSIHEMQSYTCDDYFGFSGDSDGRNILAEKIDIAVGRFPVGTREEAAAVVDKTIAYMQDTEKGEWKTRLCFLADDGDNNSHVFEADSVAQYFQMQDSNYLIKKIYWDAYKQETSASGESYPMAKDVFLNLVKKGALMFNYTGHGGTNNWSNEGILKMYDIQSMFNKPLGLWVAATCNFGHWDVAKQSGAEALLLNPNGGSVATFSASRTVYSAQNYRLNKRLAQSFFVKENGQHLRLGDIVRRAKNNTDGTVNKMTFTLLGDPALMLHYPDEFHVVTETINGNSLANADTLSALGEVRLTGYIADNDDNLVDDFNGYVHVSIMDKEETLKTLANDVGSQPFVYKDRPNMIFVGKATVRDGRFELFFRVPKDIKYTYGKGRILYYAADEQNGYDANGSCTEFVVGGESYDYVPENQGPQVSLYLNTPDFRSGDVVNERPLFVAHVEDESGINTVGSGIGHDIIMRLNNDTHQETVLNDYYEAEFGTYKRGLIKYKMPEMQDGAYSLFFRVWDLQNNSTTVTIGFDVQRGYEPFVYSLTCYPNPATDVVYFVYEHNRPDELLELTANIYDLQGALLWTSTRTVASATARTEPIAWNLKDDNGQRVRAGIYLLKMLVGMPEGKKAINTVKIIVNGQ